MSKRLGDMGAMTRVPRKRKGKPSTYLGALQLAIADDPDAVRDEFVAVGAIPFCQGVIEAMKPGRPCSVCGREGTGERWAFRLFAEVSNWVGSGETLLQTFLVQLGAPIADARAAVEQVGSAPRDPHEIAAQARAFLAWYDGPGGPGRDSE